MDEREYVVAEHTSITEFMRSMKEAYQEGLVIVGCTLINLELIWHLVLEKNEEKGVKNLMRNRTVALPVYALNALNWEFINSLGKGGNEAWQAYDTFRKELFRKSIRYMVATFGIEKGEVLGMYQEMVDYENSLKRKPTPPL